MEKDKRAKVRKYGYAKIICPSSGVPGYMRDLGERGFRAELMENVEWPRGSTQNIRVLPYEESGIESFTVGIEVRWLKKREPTFSLGALISGFDTQESRERFQKLLKYYEDLIMQA